MFNILKIDVLEFNLIKTINFVALSLTRIL